MNKFSAILNLFRKGAVISDAALWKQRQVTATVLGSVIMAVVGVLNAYGYNLPIDNETALAIAGGVLGVVNVCLTYVSSDKVGYGTSISTDASDRPTEAPEQDVRVPSTEPNVQAQSERRARPEDKQQDSIYQN